MLQLTFGFHKMRECSPVTVEVLASPEGLCSMELFSSCPSAFPYSALDYLTTLFDKNVHIDQTKWEDIYRL